MRDMRDMSERREEERRRRRGGEEERRREGEGGKGEGEEKKIEGGIEEVPMILFPHRKRSGFNKHACDKHVFFLVKSVCKIKHINCCVFT
jgi:hypothetical protein